MIAALRVMGRAYRHLNVYGYTYVWANLAFVVLSLPVVTMPAAWAGLCRMGYHALRSPNVDWDEFIAGVREFLVRGIGMGLFNAAFVVINVSNLLSYSGNSLTESALRTFWIVVLIVWFSLQFYAYPLYYAMEKPSLLGAFRNAAVMLLFNPVFTLTLLVGLLILWSLSTILVAAWALLTVSLMAIVANVAVQDRLRKAGFDQPTETAQVERETVYGMEGE